MPELTRDFVRANEQTEYSRTRMALMAELAPSGVLEQLFADEITTATWRLRRCSLLEGALPIDDDESVEQKQKSIDRARAQAHRILRQSIAELRVLQTERQIRKELEITENIGLADSAKVNRVCSEVCADYEEAAPEPQAALAPKPQRITLRDLDNLMTLADKKLCADIGNGNPSSSGRSINQPQSHTSVR
jgi:hypothetical protein